MHFGMDTLVSREKDKYGVKSDFIEDFEHRSRRVSKEISQDLINDCRYELKSTYLLKSGSWTI